MSCWQTVALGDIAQPKQWRTLSMANMQPAGFPVYGANGRIGFTDSYTHEKPTILIGCRGSCGTVHVTEPRSYANGNAMALDGLDALRVDLAFLVQFLRHRGFRDVTTGTSQPQIIRQNLVRVHIPLPPLTEQRRIAEVLDGAEALRAKRRDALTQLDTLSQAIFLDLFGDPTTNPKGWPRRPIGEVARVITGNTPPRANPAYYGTAIEWIKSDNINTPHDYLTKADEGLSQSGKGVARTAPPGSILLTCIAGSPACIGNAAMTDREVAFNQQINALVPLDGDAHFLYAQIIVGKRLIQEASTAGMKGMVSKSRLEKVSLIFPPLKLQRDFARRVAAVERLKAAHRASLAEMDALFASLQHRAFRGEL